MKLQLTALALAAALLGAFVVTPATPAAQAGVAGGLEIPVKENIGGGTLEGTLTIQELDFVAGQLLASGVFEGTFKKGNQTQNVVQEFENIPLDIGTKQQKCDILFLDLGPIFLDVLGLQVDLSEIRLDVDAVPGAGNLLGNLLCAVAGLLDEGPTGPLLGILDQLLDIINDLLGGL